ncbi:hypothetical protein MHUMG1_04251 [Metarhizium humberi]|uniref:Uncharacterized protein n=4 Tax=Metarhizium TaxID=5529 RepID=A0A9P8MEQ9_9HYPO
MSSNSFFLPLAPTTSASYPRAPASRTSPRVVAADMAPAPEPVRRRSSSSSSGGFRVLKLSPVHWGEHLDDHKEDFHEATTV